MSSFLNYLDEELSYLMRLDKDLAEDPAAPGKHAVILKHKDGNDYYWDITTTNGKREPRYLGDAGSEKLQKVARSSYKKVLMQVVKHNIIVLKKAAKSYRPVTRSAVIAKLSPCLQNLRFDAEYDTIMKELKEWANEDYQHNPKPFKDTVILAKDGTRVRSKSECIIYNILLEAGIPFHYDPVMTFKRLNMHGEIEEYSESPDFLIKCPDESYIIIEHAGMLTLPQYAADLANKLQIYQLNGYFMGYSLFVTSDDIEGGIDSQEISKIIDCIRRRFPYL